jgi:translation initiation factor 1
MSEKKKPNVSSGFGSLGGLFQGNSFSKPSSDSKLVYSTDPALNRICQKCKERESACVCEAPEAVAEKLTAVLRVEKGGRNGKTVTVIDQLPKNEAFLKEWTVKLKKKCGSGGTYLLDGKAGVIEIQGDHRELIRKLFLDSGIRTKG